jgi:Ca2+-transporting ATPase
MISRLTASPQPATDSRVEYDAASIPGLDDATAASRLAAEGANEIAAQRPRSVMAVAIEVAREPMFLLLVAAGSVYLASGNARDALMLLGFVFVVMTITIVQEQRTERALDALRDLSSPRALVIRNGEARRIDSREVVRGDIIVVAEGERVPADALVRRATHLCVDEALLTGESVPVRKRAAPDTAELEPPGGEDLASVFSGTLVTAGQAVCEVKRTGAATEIGRIGQTLRGIVTEPTPLQRETRRVVRMLAAWGLVACGVGIIGYSLLRGGSASSWREGLLAGIAMAMAILPEEFPVVLTVFLALGAWRISRCRVLTRRMPAIETLGAATVLCVDKTGTLTENRMTLARVAWPGGRHEFGTGALVPPAMRVLVLASRASRRDPFDPMERALRDAAGTEGDGGPPLREYPLGANLPVVGYAYPGSADGSSQLAAKGAPEAIARLCGLADAERDEMLEAMADLAAEGLRILAVAEATLVSAELPTTLTACRLRYVGLVAFADPVRADVPAAISECQAAGVRVVMITGDYPATAIAIARAAGLRDPETVLTGRDLESLTAVELAARVAATQVFARVVPEQKMRIVSALQARGEVVAMTGDGVNDAPALRAAHIGIAMGGRGTDVAREAAALVLLDDNFTSIVVAIRLGRRIYDNIRNAVGFIIAVHVPIAGLSILPALVPGFPLLLLPVHIVFLEMIIDPACSLVFEAEAGDPEVMRRPPRRSSERLFSTRTVVIAALQGLSVLAACLGIFAWMNRTWPVDSTRAVLFACLVSGILAIILQTRSRTRTAFAMLREPNTAAHWIVGGAAALLALVLGVPVVSHFLHFTSVPAPNLAIGLVCGLGCVAWLDVLKRSRRWLHWVSNDRS